MTDDNHRKLTHSTFTIERTYRATPHRVFEVFADPVRKQQWFDGPSDEWEPISSALDFREGGREHNESRHLQAGFVSRFDATYHEIVDGVRVVFSYEMRVDGVRLSVSLVAVELVPTGEETRLTHTEHGVYFDDLDNSAEREAGTRELLDRLALFVES